MIADAYPEVAFHRPRAVGQKDGSMSKSCREELFWARRLSSTIARRHRLRCEEYSFSGAKLALAGRTEVPNDFELHIPTKCCSYRARLVRHDAEGIAV